MNKSREIYLARNRTKRPFKIYTFESIRNAVEEYSFKKYGKRSFSLGAHMLIYKGIRNEGFFDLRKLLTEHKQHRYLSCKI